MSSRHLGHHRTLAVFVVGGLAVSPLARSDTPPPQRLDTIVVISSLVPTARRQVGAAVSVLPAQELELRGYPSLADALRTQPGIAVTNSGGAGKNTVVRIRGEEHYRTLFMIDGVKALDTSAPQVAPSFDSLLTTSDLERVEVLRGPQGFIYGADAGGVVNMLTKRGEGELGSQVALDYGAYSTRKLDAAVFGGDDRGDYYVSVADFATDGFNSQTADAVLRDDDGDDNTTLHAKLGWNATDSLRLQLVARDIDAETEYDSCFTQNFALVHDCRGTTEQTTYKVSAEHAAGRFSNAFGYSSVDIVRDNFTQGQSAFLTEGTLSRLEYTGSYQPGDSLTKVVYGLDFQDEGIVDADGNRSREQQGYYAEYQHDFENDLFLSLGARYDDNEDFGSHLSSRLSAVYRHAIGESRSLKYRASVGTGFRAPSMFELAYNSGPFAFPPASGLSLVEEQSRGYDFGVEYESGRVRTEVTYFDQRIEDEIFFDLTTFAGYLQSPGQSRSKGVEVTAEVSLGRDWDLLANWTSNDAASATNEQRLRRPKDFGNVGLWFRSFNDVVSFIANYRFARDSIDIGGVALDDYGVFDISATYHMNDGLEIFGRVQNLTDEDYEELLGHNTAGRSVYAGVRLRF